MAKTKTDNEAPSEHASGARTDKGLSGQESFREGLRQKYPNRAANAVSSSRGAAITLFCLECVGGSYVDTKNCTDKTCFLWNWRPGREKPPATEAQIANGKALSARLGS